jgi:small multidrug resistance pump
LRYVLLLIAIVSEVVATMLLKASDGWSKWWFGLYAVFFYAIAGALLSIVLKQMSVGIAYAIWAGLGIALVCAASAVMLNQRLDVAAYCGIALIIGGVLLIALRSNVVLQ